MKVIYIEIIGKRVILNQLFIKTKAEFIDLKNKSDEKNVLLNLTPLVEDYKMVSAHEIGHEILKKYGGTMYSYGHKGSSEVYSFDQHIKDDAAAYPANGEIDILPYYPSSHHPLSIIDMQRQRKMFWD